MSWKTVTAASALLGACSMAHAVDGCAVLLCMANPAGPMAVPYCQPIIKQLWKDLAKGKAFPKCKQASGPSGSSYVAPNTSYYDACPSGTAALSSGIFATPSAPAPSNEGETQQTLFVGIGTGDGVLPTSTDENVASPMPPKVCVGGQLLRTTMVATGQLDADENPIMVQANVYENISALAARAPSGYAVYIDDKLFSQVNR